MGSGKQFKIILWMFKRNYPSSRHWYFYLSIFFRQVLKTAFKYHHYAGVIVDVFYDHFLAKNGDVFQWKFKRLCYCFLRIFERKYSHFKWKTVMLMPYDRPKLAPQLPEGNNILTQMDGRTKKIKMRFTEELRSYTLNLRRRISLTIWERMRNKINRRINFLTIRKRKFCIVD
jgi:hypothetical protein